MLLLLLAGNNVQGTKQRPEINTVNLLHNILMTCHTNFILGVKIRVQLTASCKQWRIVVPAGDILECGRHESQVARPGATFQEYSKSHIDFQRYIYIYIYINAYISCCLTTLPSQTFRYCNTTSFTRRYWSLYWKKGYLK
jgi:hypothetical protein